MNQPEDAELVDYPHGRGYGKDYMRGGEVLGGYGYAERDEYSKARGEIYGGGDKMLASSETSNGHSPGDTLT